MCNEYVLLILVVNKKKNCLGELWIYTYILLANIVYIITNKELLSIEINVCMNYEFQKVNYWRVCFVILWIY